jgi:hypothetical protein
MPPTHFSSVPHPLLVLHGMHPGWVVGELAKISIEPSTQKTSAGAPLQVQYPPGPMQVGPLVDGVMHAPTVAPQLTVTRKPHTWPDEQSAEVVQGPAFAESATTAESRGNVAESVTGADKSASKPSVLS